ncbi:MAG: TIR domain-containing protein [Pseudomonadota bacterium]
MPKGIFICYRRADTQYPALLLRDRLATAFPDAEVFIDVDYVRHGADFRATISEALDQCDASVICIGKRWLDIKDSKGNRRLDLPNDFVRLEIEQALSRKIPIFPVLFDDAVMPSETELPEPIRELAFRLAANVRHSNFSKDVGLLVDELVRLPVGPPIREEAIEEADDDAGAGSVGDVDKEPLAGAEADTGESRIGETGPEGETKTEPQPDEGIDVRSGLDVEQMRDTALLKQEQPAAYGKYLAYAAVFAVAALLAFFAYSYVQEQRSWSSATHTDTVTDYQWFISEHPRSSLIEEARKRIVDLKAADARAWAKALEIDTIEAYEEYLRSHGGGEQVAAAKARISHLEEHNAVWEKALRTNTIAGYQVYLGTYPDGPKAAEAKEKIVVLQAEAAWIDARDKDILSAYEAFLRDYPESEFASAASKRISRLNVHITTCKIPRLENNISLTFEVFPKELAQIADCVRKAQIKSYGSAGHWATAKWKRFKALNKHPYPSAAHEGRYVSNFVNKKGQKDYKSYEAAKKMAAHSTIAKPSFTIGMDGSAVLGPLFIMEKMRGGFNQQTADWRYAMVMPGGKLFGLTKGKNSAGLKFCHDCHAGAEKNDHMFFMPTQVRK